MLNFLYGYIYMDTYICIYTYIYMYIYVHILTYIYIYIYICILMYVYSCTQKFVCMYVYIYMYIISLLFSYVCIYIHICIIYLHVYVYIKIFYECVNIYTPNTRSLTHRHPHTPSLAQTHSCTQWFVHTYKHMDLYALICSCSWMHLNIYVF